MKSYDSVLATMRDFEKSLPRSKSHRATDREAAEMKDLLKSMVELVYNKFQSPYPSNKCVRQAIKSLKKFGLKKDSLAPSYAALDYLYARELSKSLDFMKVWFYDITRILA